MTSIAPSGYQIWRRRTHRLAIKYGAAERTVWLSMAVTAERTAWLSTKIVGWTFLTKIAFFPLFIFRGERDLIDFVNFKVVGMKNPCSSCLCMLCHALIILKKSISQEVTLRDDKNCV